MRIARAAWATFRLPFATPFTTAHEVSEVREGVILRLATEEGLVGYGEASPLMAFGGTLRHTLQVLSCLTPCLVGLGIAEAEKLLAALEPATACALDTACCDLRGQEKGAPVASLLSREPKSVVPVNATVANVEAAHAAVDAGFTCVKLKVGWAESAFIELKRIEAVREAIGPAVRLRIDANGGWSVDRAIEIIRTAQRFDLELVEQPVASDDLPGMAQVRASVDTPIAADESVGGVRQVYGVIAHGAADILVVKPMPLGGLRPALRIIEVAREHGLEAFVTTTIDSGIGVAAALHVAASLPEPIRACGLATSRLLTQDLVADPLPVERGMMRVPSRPGLGVTVDEERLAACGGVWHEVGL